MGFLARVVSDCCVDYSEAHVIALKRYKGFLFDSVELDERPTGGKDWQLQVKPLEALQEHR